MSAFPVVEPQDVARGDRLRITLPSGIVVIGTVRAFIAVLDMATNTVVRRFVVLHVRGERRTIDGTVLADSLLELLGRAPDEVIEAWEPKRDSLPEDPDQGEPA